MMNLKMITLLLLLLPTIVLANSVVEELQKDWAIANYQLKENAHEKAFDTLVIEADAALTNNPRSAEFLRDKGSIVKAKEYFEKAKIAPQRSARSVADKGRHEDMAKALIEVEEALN